MDTKELRNQLASYAQLRAINSPYAASAASLLIGALPETGWEEELRAHGFTRDEVRLVNAAHETVAEYDRTVESLITKLHNRRRLRLPIEAALVEKISA